MGVVAAPKQHVDVVRNLQARLIIMVMPPPPEVPATGMSFVSRDGELVEAWCLCLSNPPAPTLAGLDFSDVPDHFLGRHRCHRRGVGLV